MHASQLVDVDRVVHCGEMKDVATLNVDTREKRFEAVYPVVTTKGDSKLYLGLYTRAMSSPCELYESTRPLHLVDAWRGFEIIQQRLVRFRYGGTGEAFTLDSLSECLDQGQAIHAVLLTVDLGFKATDPLDRLIQQWGEMHMSPWKLESFVNGPAFCQD